MRSKTLKIDLLARVEGEGGVTIRIRNDAVADVKLRIFEPPRLFESFLRGRNYMEVPDITARICGICPIAYQMSSSQAIEDAFGIHVDGQLRALRRLIYCGEWIESHVLHIYFLHAPDFCGYADGISMARDYPDIIQRGLRLKKAGNSLVALLGGRPIHPINIRPGGFYKVPARSDLLSLMEEMKWARDAALATVQWVASLEIPEFERDYTFVALRAGSGYPIDEGRLVSNRGLDIPVRDYEEFFAELQVPYSTALHSVWKGNGAYCAGPLARYNLNHDRLSPLAREAASSAGMGAVCRNPFRSIVVRAIEVLYACEEALRLLEQYEPPQAPFLEVPPRAATGYGCTEAPRGILYHRYRLSDTGTVLDARIVPPTSQNQRTIEEDLRDLLPSILHLRPERVRARCEQAIRNYDPCISCSTHFLRL